ncbi:MAG: hypothetical protein AAGE52_41375 [Myxococcota bacterium]
MLDGVDQIKWAKEKDALGRPEEIPALLGAIAEGEHPRRALRTLREHLLPSALSSAAPVTVRCVPFLRQLLAQEVTRGEILRLLADLSAAGDHAHFCGLSPAITEAALTDPVLHVAVVDGLEEFRSHLGDRNPEVRASAALALAFTSRELDDVALLFRTAEQEPSPAAQASMIACLGILAARAHRPLPSLEAFEGTRLTAVAIAIAQRYVGEDLDPVAAETLLEFVEVGVRTPTGFVVGGSLTRLAAGFLADDAARRNDGGAVERLIRDCRDADREMVALSVLRAAFGHGQGEIARTADSLTSLQTRLLRTLNDLDLRLWETDRAFFGIPTTTGLKRYLSKARKKRRPLDAQIFETPLWFHAHQALHGRLRRDHWHEMIVSALEPAEVVALVQDAFASEDPYHLYPWPEAGELSAADIAMREARFWGGTLINGAWDDEVLARLETLVDEDGDRREILAMLLAMVAWRDPKQQLATEFERLVLPVVNDPDLEQGAREVLLAFYKPRRRRILQAATADARKRLQDLAPPRKTKTPEPNFQVEANLEATTEETDEVTLPVDAPVEQVVEVVAAVS